MDLPNHLQLSLFVPLPLPAPGSAPEAGGVTLFTADITQIFISLVTFQRLQL